MSRSVYRYDVAISDHPTNLALPQGATVRHAGVAASTARDCVSLWVEVFPDGKAEQRAFVVHGTGHQVGAVEEYAGTVVDPRHNGIVVWHVYEVRA